jgi:phosphatidylserine/phosphatidylglycerophosphate/cardiolipin synthase-like enzyme
MEYIINNYLDTLIYYLTDAKNSIFGTIYITSDITKSNNPKLKKLYKVIFDKAKENINITLIFNYKTPSYKLRKSTERIINILISKNIDAFFSSKKKMLHSKVFIIDNEIIIAGSHNLTLASDSKNIELSLIIKNKNKARKIRSSLTKFCLK